MILRFEMFCVTATMLDYNAATTNGHLIQLNCGLLLSALSTGGAFKLHVLAAAPDCIDISRYTFWGRSSSINLFFTVAAVYHMR